MNDLGTPLSTAGFLGESTAQLDAILANSHPTMVEAFYMASIPSWYDLRLFAAIRNRDDGRDEGLIARLNRYSFISPLYDRDEAEPAYAVRAQERAILQERWISEDPEAYMSAHQRVLAFWEKHPDPNPFAQAQNLLYHRLFVDFEAGVEYLVSRFRTYRNDRQLPAIERLLATAREAREYLALLDSETVAGFDDLLDYLAARLAQLRGDWAKSEVSLQALLKNERLDPRLKPDVLRAEGYARSHDGEYVNAIRFLRKALTEFDRQLAMSGEITLFQTEANIQAERAYTLIALGDAHVNLAVSASGYQEREPPDPGPWRRLRDAVFFLLSLPLVLYLSPHLGRRMWHPQFWSALPGLDWIIARLFATGARYYRQADPILERYGEPAEGTVADEKLAFLYLTLGDTREAKRLFLRLLAEVEAPLGPYRQASTRVGLADAYLQLGQPEQALEPLRAALAVLTMYGDRTHQARARELLAEALLVTGEQTEATEHFAASCRRYQEGRRWVEATRLVEHLQTWVQSGNLVEAAQTRAKEVIGSLRRRHYPGSYRHPLLVRFRQLMLMLLPLILVLVPLLTITLETGVILAPEIRFRPAPIMNPEQTVTLQLSPGVTGANVYRVVVSQTLLWIAGALILAYLVLSLVLGLAAITFTPLRTVEARGRGATVCLDDHRIALGYEETTCLEDQGTAVEQEALTASLPWIGISQFVKADVRVWHRPLQDGSSFGLAATQEPMVVGGSTRWYSSLRDRVSCLVPAGARVIDLDYTVLRSLLGALYGLNLLFVGLLGILAAFAKGEVILYDLPGTQYSAVDLYPYFFLCLVVAPLWWGVVQPLRRCQYLQPRSRLPLWILGTGLLLALVQVLLRFRPVLTVVNLYLPLTTLILLVSAEIAVWRAQVARRKVYPAAMRMVTAALVIVVCLLMVSVIWRETRAYHYLVQGNTLRDRAWEAQDPALSESMLNKAIHAYGRAADIGSRPILGIDTKAATGIPAGVPAAGSFTWLSALTSQAAMHTQLGHYVEATQAYTEALRYTDEPDQVCAWLAVARLSQATGQAEQGVLTIDQTQYQQALRHLDDAMLLNPRNAAYYLWRGVVYHAVGQLTEAAYNYQQALAREGPGDRSLTPDQKERALTGLGWIMYVHGNFQEALEVFQQARKVKPDSSEAWLGEGYALYSLERFEEAESVWEHAAKLEPRDPTILLSLGTLHWKLGGKAGQALGRDRCTEYRRSAEYFTKATDRENLWPQLDQDVAFTYRTRAHVEYLLADCPDLNKVVMYRAAVDSFSEALKLDPEQAPYWYRRGRLAYSISTNLRKVSPLESNEWLLQAIADIDQAIELDPNNATYWHDRGWMSYRVWEWQVEAPGPETAEWLFLALADMEEAREFDPVDRGTSHRPNFWIDERIRPEAIDGNLSRGDDHFAAGDYETALAYYELVANKVKENARAAFKAGLASLALGKRDEALAWYESGLERVRSTDNVLEAQKALQELGVWASALGLEAEEVSTLFKTSGIAAFEAKDARSAFALGLAALRLGDPEGAEAWYRDGIERALAEDDLESAEDALVALHLESLANETLVADGILALFEAWDIELEPHDAQLAFDLARASLIQNDLEQSAQLCNQGLELAVAASDIEVVRAAARDLRDFLLGHPDMGRAEVYWPLHDDLAARERAVAALDRPDLYWRYRAEFGFRLLENRQLLRERPGHEEPYEEIFASIIDDIERAYALNPDEHQIMRDFFVDANIGWLYLRRGYDYAKEKAYEQALADYEEASRRIQSTSENAALDLTEAIFKAGLTALRLEELERSTKWYDRGTELVRRLTEFGLHRQVGPAIEDLQALLEENPDLAPVAAPILDQLEELR